MRTKKQSQVAFATFDAFERAFYAYLLELFKWYHELPQDSPSLPAADYAVGRVLARRASPYRGMSGDAVSRTPGGVYG